MRPGASLVRNWVKWFEMLFYVFFLAVCWLLVLVCLFLLLVFLLLHRFTWFGVLDGSCLIHPVTGSLVKLYQIQTTNKFCDVLVLKPTPQPKCHQTNSTTPEETLALRAPHRAWTHLDVTRPLRHGGFGPFGRVGEVASLWPCLLSLSRLEARSKGRVQKSPKANLNHRLDGVSWKPR